MRRSRGSPTTPARRSRAQSGTPGEEDWSRLSLAAPFGNGQSGTAKAFARMQRNNSTRQESTASPRGSAVGYPLRGLTRIAARWPRFVMATVILASCACAGYAFFFLRFKSDRAQMLERQAELRQHWAAYSKTFDHASDVIVVVESKNLDEIKHAIDDLADRLRREPDNFSSVLARFEAGALQRKWLQYVSPRRLQIGLSRVNQYSPILRGDYRPIELDYLFTQMGDQIEARMEQAADKPLTPARNAADLQARRPADNEPQRLHRQSGRIFTRLGRTSCRPMRRQTPFGTRRFTFLSDRGTMGYLRVVPRTDAAEESGEWQSLARLEANQRRGGRSAPRLSDRPHGRSDPRTRRDAALAVRCALGDRGGGRSAAWW